MDRWAAIDFETANERRDSACALGVAVIADGVVADAASWLIQPPDNRYHWFNTRLHGIGPEHTECAPGFGEVWERILPYLHGARLLAHNAPFDVAVLRALLARDGLETPAFDYACTVAMSRRAFPRLRAHRLDVVCDHCGIGLHHHDAASDASACAEVALRCRDAVGALTVTEAVEALGVPLRPL